MAVPIEPIDDLPTEEGLFPIRTVCSLTGVHPVTLRAWERRYGLIRPKRTPKGHRLYSGEDIELIRHILRLLDQGVSIGQVGQLLDARKAPAPPEPEASGPGDPAWNAYRMRLREAVGILDESAVSQVWEDALSLFSLDTMILQLALPVRDSLRERPASDQAAAAELSFLSRWLRQTLNTRLRQMSPSIVGPTVVVVPLDESPDDLCLLRFALACRREGIGARLLGPGVPLGGLGTLAGKANARAVILYSERTPGHATRLSRFCQSWDRAHGVLCTLGGGLESLPPGLGVKDIVSLGTDPDKAAVALHEHLAR
ncbi:helix-turn-helix-type transcriptional regulator [Thioalkalivibrio denitrificans]|uniref:Helix-turn-helix-type transcriptional regulator n=2 Tax=Thioalkalivibrio denitrificans TaxID=108003 RepID=A0A1V3NLU7_9GAMM|nr:helix-turn-helix-type transcriptional regulator [Thioalkalivibrio denitrificans]